MKPEPEEKEEPKQEPKQELTLPPLSVEVTETITTEEKIGG